MVTYIMDHPVLWLYEKKEDIWLNPVTKTLTPTEQSKKQRDTICTDEGISIKMKIFDILVWLTGLSALSS